jgi:CP family cyanate transporter-like MFS transporter
VTITLGVPSVNAYAAFAWLPSLLIATAGVTPAEAGALLSLYAIMGFPSGILLPILATRMKNVGLLVFAGVGFFLAGYAGLLFAPKAAPVLWVALIGLGPLLFPLSLVLINARTRTHAGSVALSGFVQGIGYVLGAIGPLVVGILQQVTGGWTVPILFLVAISLCAVVAGVLLARPRFVEDEVARRPSPAPGP